MAQSHTQHASEPTTRPLNDADIYISVGGYIGVIPAPSFPEGATESQQVAIREGVKQLGLRRSQPIAKKAADEGKDVRQAVQSFLNTFEPDPKQDFQTIGSKRLELASELLAKTLAAAGKPHDEATVAKHVVGFMNHDRHGPRVTEAMNAWLTAYTPPTKRGSGGSGAAAGADIGSLDEL